MGEGGAGWLISYTSRRRGLVNNRAHQIERELMVLTSEQHRCAEHNFISRVSTTLPGDSSVFQGNYQKVVVTAMHLGTDNCTNVVFVDGVFVLFSFLTDCHNHHRTALCKL